MKVLKLIKRILNEHIKKNSYVEIYDFDKNIIYQKHIKSFTNTNKLVVSFRHSLIPFFSNNSTDFHYLLGFVNNESHYILQNHKIKSLENFQNDITLNKSYDTQIRAYYQTTGVSCFQTQNQIIICFYLNGNHNNNSPYDNINYIISAYDTNLQEINRISFHFNCSYNNIYYKCIHLKR